MIQQGIVSQIEGPQLLVAALSEKDQEESCETGGCGSGCTCNVTGQVFRAINKKDLPLKEGDRVEVTVPQGSIGKGLLLVFGLPVLFGYGLWRWLPLLTGGSSRGWMAAAGVVLGIVLALFLGRKEDSVPEVSSIL